MKQIYLLFAIFAFTSIQLSANNDTDNKLKMKELKELAKKENYALHHSGATKNYITFITHLIAEGHSTDAEKAAKDLINDSKKAKACDTRLLAVELLIDANPAKSIEIAIDALKKEDCPQYRIAAISAAAKHNSDENFYREIITVFIKEKKDDVKTDIANWIAKEAENKERRLTMQFLAKPLIENIDTQNIDLQKTIASTLVKLENPIAITPLINLIVNHKEPTLSIGKEALASFNRFEKETTNLLAQSMMASNDTSKIAIIELLALKKSNRHLGEIISLTNIGNDTVKVAAYKAMKEIVQAKDINSMYSLLENTEQQYIPYIEDALIASLQLLPLDQQFQEICQRAEHTNNNKRYLYYGALASTGNIYAHQYILQGLKSDNEIEKTAASAAYKKAIDNAPNNGTKLFIKNIYK